mgnify:CR=1 FL=1
MMPPFVYLIIHIMVEFSIFMIVTLSLNLEVGHTGIPQFGRVIAVIAGAFAVGAIPGRILAYMMGLPYGAEYAIYKYNYWVVDEISNKLAANVPLSITYFILSLLLAAVCGAAVGWLTSRPAIRLREAYLGISLLAFGDVLMWIGYNYEPLVGGSTATAVPDPFRWIWKYRFTVVSFVIVVIAFMMLLIVERLTKSPFGRTLKMLRDNELAATVFGKDIVKIRTRSLVIGSSIAAVAGALYVIYSGTCNAAAFTRLTWTFWPWAYMMLGGVGSNIGVVIGVLIFIIIRKLIVLYRFELAPYLPFDPIWLEYTLAGLAIILIVLFRPYGLLPEKPEPTIPPERIRELLEEIRKEEETEVQE